MSILSMVQKIASDAGFQQPTYVVGNPDEIAVQLLSQIERETRRLSDEFFWQKLVTIYQFPFVNNQESYNLPSDFNFILPNTIWNQSRRQPIICPLTPEDYGIQKNYLVTSAYYKMAYVYQNQMWITPVPSASTLSISLNDNPLSSSVGSNVVTINVSTTNNIVNGQLITISGASAFGSLTTGQLNITAPCTIVNSTTLSYTISGQAATSSETGGGNATLLSLQETVTYQYCSNNIYQSNAGVGQTTILSDTDTTVVKEFIVELGAKLRFLVSKGLISPAEMEASFEKKDYDFQIKRQMMIDGVGQKTLHMKTGGSAYWMAGYTQDSNWPQG